MWADVIHNVPATFRVIIREGIAQPCEPNRSIQKNLCYILWAIIEIKPQRYF